MKIKAIYDINIDIEEFVEVELLDKSSTPTDIVRVVEAYVNAINTSTLYTIPKEEKDKLIEEIKKFIKNL